MFHAWLVKMAKMEAASTPSIDPGNSTSQIVMVADRKPRIGTDCRMSSSGISTRDNLRQRAAASPYTKVKIREKNSATNMRNTERSA